MKIIGENIHIISPRVKQAIADRDKRFFQDMAVQQVAAGAWAVDLNIGPQKKHGVEILPWLVQTVQEVVDVPLCLDTTNLAAIEAACPLCKQQPIINSTSAEEERLEKVPLVAKKYNTKLIALTLEKSGIPVSAEARVNIALEKLLPRAEEGKVRVRPAAFELVGQRQHVVCQARFQQLFLGCLAVRDEALGLVEQAVDCAQHLKPVGNDRLMQ